jgi:hypothetical protein
MTDQINIDDGGDALGPEPGCNIYARVFFNADISTIMIAARAA